jgi:carbamate kinase
LGIEPVRVVVALGGNALLRRGQSMTAKNQRENVRIAARSLAALIQAGHDLIVTHGNGPQVGLLALQGAAYQSDELYPLDVLNAETEGMIGYLIEQELGNLLPSDRPCATLLTQTEVDPADPAFAQPSKPIGPVYSEGKAERLAAENRWSIAPEGDGWRRVVASPAPKRIFEIGVIELLVAKGVVVICAGGGGIPVIMRPDGGLVGVEAVVDKDRTSALLARQLGVEALLLLTDVAAVYADWDTPGARPIRRAPPEALASIDFAAGSIGPKVEAACDFASSTGGFAGIGRLEDAPAILAQRRGTIVTIEADGLDFRPESG